MSKYSEEWKKERGFWIDPNSDYVKSGRHQKYIEDLLSKSNPNCKYFSNAIATCACRLYTGKSDSPVRTGLCSSNWDCPYKKGANQ